MENFGANIKKHRLKCGLKQRKLAEKIGTSKESISKYELGKRTPSIIVAKNLAAALGVPLGELIGH